MSNNIKIMEMNVIIQQIKCLLYFKFDYENDRKRPNIECFLIMK